MKNIIRALVIGGVAALALTSTAARADGGEWREHGEASRGRDRGWREQRERGREWHELGEARERFYATWQGDPWRRVRFERWYDHRRDEMARREDHQRRDERERGRHGRWRR